ncbi:MAG TPA: copper transporter [Firmicutes bacterium]|nr:copper transporter [Bacillota bacterium]
MFINIRYLVITLAAVFIALGIGILIGFQLDSQDIILQQQQDLIKSMETKFNQLTQANQDLETEIKKLQNNAEQDEVFMKSIFADYVNYKLSGLNIAIIETSGNQLYPHLRYALNMAGANISTSIVVTDKILTVTEEEKSQLDLPIATVIANAIAHGDTEDLNYLRQKGFIEARGDFTIVPDYVILAGGNSEENTKAEIVDVPLIRELKRNYISLVGVEASDAEYSYMNHYKKERISTVDNVDTVIGQTSLVLVMTGAEGNYGIKASANALIPYFNKEELR